MVTFFGDVSSALLFMSLLTVLGISLSHQKGVDEDLGRVAVGIFLAVAESNCKVK